MKGIKLLELDIKIEDVETLLYYVINLSSNFKWLEAGFIEYGKNNDGKRDEQLAVIDVASRCSVCRKHIYKKDSAYLSGWKWPGQTLSKDVMVIVYCETCLKKVEDFIKRETTREVQEIFQHKYLFSEKN
jgi:hypothetical protein